MYRPLEARLPVPLAGTLHQPTVSAMFLLHPQLTWASPHFHSYYDQGHELSQNLLLKCISLEEGFFQCIFLGSEY